MAESEYLPVKKPKLDSKDPAERTLANALREYTSISRSYDAEFDAEIRALQPHWFPPRCKTGVNKIKLLEMAKNGEERPNLHKDKRLGQALTGYTCKKKSSYDPEFDAEVRILRPDWFEDTTIPKKRELLEMAKNGEKRPTKAKKLGQALISYTSKKSGSRDLEFDAEIRRLRPDWFEDTTILKKRELLEMAKNGEKRPTGILGSALSRYTHPHVSIGSGRIRKGDLEFDVEIRRLRPDWFEDTAAAKKRELLEMAKNGEARPTLHTKGQTTSTALGNYTNKKNKIYDPEFDAQIRKAAPGWFLGSWYEDIAIVRKRKLLEMAKNGEERPKRRAISSALIDYTDKKHKSYDPEFDAQIREARPDWFEKRRSALNKQKLLELAKSGKRKPHYFKSPSNPSEASERRLAAAFYNYTRKGSGYNPEFDAQIREIRPDWFRAL
ncbi:MAG: hypothetical protein WC919_00290 [Candidatus Paceibacterota bacterium]|jgi:hypothetical protein